MIILQNTTLKQNNAKHALKISLLIQKILQNALTVRVTTLIMTSISRNAQSVH